MARRVLAVALGLLSAVFAAAPAAVAQEWVFATPIPCDSAPVYGVPFNNCAASNTRTFRVGIAQAWRMFYKDATSEAAVGLYRLIEPHGTGGMGPATNSMADWLRSADSLRNVTSGAYGWVQNDQFVAFQRPNQNCVGFMRTGPPGSSTVYWTLGGAFCRDSASPIPPDEARFLVNAVKVR